MSAARGGAALSAAAAVPSDVLAALAAAVVDMSVRGDAALAASLLLLFVCEGALLC